MSKSHWLLKPYEQSSHQGMTLEREADHSRQVYGSLCIRTWTWVLPPISINRISVLVHTSPMLHWPSPWPRMKHHYVGVESSFLRGCWGQMIESKSVGKLGQWEIGDEREVSRFHTSALSQMDDSLQTFQRQEHTCWVSAVHSQHQPAPGISSFVSLPSLTHFHCSAQTC